MTDPSICENCRYWSWTPTIGHHCDYVCMTGRTRLAQMTEAQRKNGSCPVAAIGNQIKLTMRPRVHPYDEVRCSWIVREKIDKTRFYGLYREGLNDAEIAQKIGCSTSVVFRWRKRVGLDPNVKKGYEDD